MSTMLCSHEKDNHTLKSKLTVLCPTPIIIWIKHLGTSGLPTDYHSNSTILMNSCYLSRCPAGAKTWEVFVRHMSYRLYKGWETNWNKFLWSCLISENVSVPSCATEHSLQTKEHIKCLLPSTTPRLPLWVLKVETYSTLKNIGPISLCVEKGC